MIIHCCFFVLISCLFSAQGGLQTVKKTIYSVPDPTRIVGGSLTTIEEYPYQVSFQWNGTHLCGGSILSNIWILTAAHCTYNRNASFYTIRSGSSYYQTGGELSSIKAFFVHEKYNVTSLDYDIAVIQLLTPLAFNSQTIPIPPTTYREQLRAGDMAVVTGWGRLNSGGAISQRLRKVEVPLIAWTECTKAYQDKTITEQMLCAGVLNRGGRDACQGDSGGPLAFNGKLIGIVSWGFGCAHPDYPGVYTRVAAFEEWIANKTGI